VAVLSILALGTTSSVMQEMRLARYVTRGNEAFFAGMAATEIAKVVVTQDETPTAITLYDLRTRDVSFGGKTLRLRFFDEEALISIDKADADVLGRLPGLSEHGSLAFTLASADIKVKEDALFVSGIEPEMYAEFAPYVTTHSIGRVNINTAGPVVLEALGMTEDLIEKIQEFRAGPDGGEGTEDDGFFLTDGAIVPDLQDHAGISDPEAAFLQGLLALGRLSTSSNYIRVKAALVTGAREEPGVNAVVHLPVGNIVAWYEE